MAVQFVSATREEIKEDLGHGIDRVDHIFLQDPVNSRHLRNCTNVIQTWGNQVMDYQFSQLKQRNTLMRAFNPLAVVCAKCSL